MNPQFEPNALGIVGLKEIANLFAVPQVTVSKWRARKVLPEPDSVVSGVPVWALTSIIEFAFQTGRIVHLSRQNVERHMPKGAIKGVTKPK